VDLAPLIEDGVDGGDGVTSTMNGAGAAPAQ
jgi:hypothetical protein